MDFLEIRRKAKERAAARAAAAAHAPTAPAPEEAPARRPLSLDPLPLPPPERLPGHAPVAWSPEPEPLPEPGSPQPAAAARGDGSPYEPGASVPAAEPWTAAPPEPPPAAPDPEAERHAAEAAADAARVEQELEARLREMPAAGDARFLTWRPSGGPIPDLAPISPVDEPQEPPAAGRRREPSRGGEARGAQRRPGPVAELAEGPPGDPLDEFFYREDEPGPELGALAAPAAMAEPAVEALVLIEYLTFLLGAEEYGVEIDRVREVMRSPPITEVPRAPADVLGVITVRGEVVAVFDPRGRLGLPRGAATGGGRVIIVDDGAGPCGLLVDGVANVVRLPRGSIEARPQGIGGAGADCLEGIGRDRDRLFTVLSVPALLKPGRRAEGRG